QPRDQVGRGQTEKGRAQRPTAAPDRTLVEEGGVAHFRLLYASQQLVLPVAREYFAPGRDWRELINAGNMGLLYAVSQYGLKTQVPFRAYATHWIHLEIIESVLEQ